ncbi:MAG TPA: type VII secretion-associated protein, partial [Pseudonocardia sp.]
AGALVAAAPDHLAGLTGGPHPVASVGRPGSALPGDELAQYDYTVRLPAGWRHSGGEPERRRTLLTPSDTPLGSDLISVEQTPLGYDSAAEPDRAFRELRDRYEQARRDGSELADLTPSTRVGGRDVIAYRQRRPARDTRVDWYVVFDGDAQLSVGCQHTTVGEATVREACAVVVGSLRLRR